MGQAVEGHDDCITGYRAVSVEIKGDTPQTGRRVYPAIVPVDDPDQTIRGTVYRVSKAVLKRIDTYEGPYYRRLKLSTASGLGVWVYVLRPEKHHAIVQQD